MSYNVQPGITIDYRIGDSYETATGRTSGQILETWVANSAWVVFVLNKKSRKFHAVG